MPQETEDNLSFLRRNDLTAGLSEAQLQLLLSEMHEIKVKPNQIIIRENEQGDDIYLIKEGEVEICRLDKEGNYYHRLGLLGKEAVIGELSLIDDAPRSASVRTISDVTLLMLSAKKLRTLATKENFFSRVSGWGKQVPIYSVIVQNAAKNLTKRIRSTNDSVVRSLKRELMHAKARTEMSMFIINVFIIVSIYIVVFSIMSSLKYHVISTTFLSVPLIIVCGIPIIYVMKNSSFPLSFYGITTRNWQRSLFESMIATVLLMLFIMAYKWILIKTVATFADQPLFNLSFNLLPKAANDAEISNWMKFSAVILYLIFVPIQELIIRGALQSSFQELLVGRYRIFWAIILSNLIFSDSHTYISLYFGLTVYIPGLIWGWLYSRHRTLIGVSISHLIVGAWAIYIVGLV